MLNLDTPEVVKLMSATTAKETCKYLREIISEYMKCLNPDEELCIKLASFGVAHEIVVSEIRPYGTSLVVLSGYENGEYVSLVQHISQMNILLASHKIQPTSEEPRRIIGFHDID